MRIQVTSRTREFLDCSGIPIARGFEIERLLDGGCLRLRGCCSVGLPRRLPSARQTRASSPFGPEVAAPRPAEPRLDLVDGLAAPGAGSPLPTPAASVARWAVPGLERRRENHLQPRARAASESIARTNPGSHRHRPRTPPFRRRSRNMRHRWPTIVDGNDVVTGERCATPQRPVRR